MKKSRYRLHKRALPAAVRSLEHHGLSVREVKGQRAGHLVAFVTNDQIVTSLYTASGSFRKLSSQAESSLEDAIRTLGLEPLADKDISLISDGEFQKACIATALTRKANVILLDEPTAFLDVENRIMVLRTLQELAHGTGSTIIFSTHDIYDGARFSDATLQLSSCESQSIK